MTASLAGTRGSAAAQVWQGSGMVRSVAYIEGSSGPLFCSAHLPVAGATGALVLCSGVLADVIFGYRQELMLADELARRGVAVWRFHYRGSGYSEGDPAAITLASLVEDAVAVIAAAGEATPAPLAVMGTRCGAMVAAGAARAAGALPLVFWEAIADGAGYLREGFRARMIVDGGQLKRPQVTARKLTDEILEAGSTELVGYSLHRPLYESLVAAQLVDLVDPATRRMMIIRSRPLDGPQTPDRLAGAVGSLGVDVQTAAVGHPEGWWFHRTQHSAPEAIGLALAEAVSPWLGGVSASDVALPPTTGPRQPSFIPVPSNDPDTGTGAAVFRLLIPPSAEPNGRGAVILWGGAGMPAFGRNQVACELARRLAGTGYTVVQIDYPGCGESPGQAPTEPIDEPSKLELFDSVRAAYRSLEGMGLDGVFAIGSCQGAFAGLWTASDIEAPLGLVLLAPPVREGDEICAPGQSSAAAGTVSPRFSSALRDVVERQVPMLIAFGVDDEVYPDFEKALDGEVGSLLRDAGSAATVRVIDERIHGYMTVSGQEAAIELVLDWMTKLSPDGQPSAGTIADLVMAHLSASRPDVPLPVDLGATTSLIDAGILDSLAVFKLVAFLEQRFGVEIPDEELAWENFETIAAVAHLVQSKLEAAGIEATVTAG